MKKTVTVIVIITILLNLISIKSFAAGGDSDLDKAAGELGVGDDTIEDPGNLLNRLDDKEATVKAKGGISKTVSAITSDTVGATVANIVVKALTILPQAANEFMGNCVIFVGGEQLAGASLNPFDLDFNGFFTIYDTVTGNYELFNLSYHDIPETMPTNGATHEIYKYYIIKYYGILRNLSIAISLFVLIYIGIRMAISTVASDKAKYNKMLLSWLCSLILVFFMHYIIIGVSWISSYLLSVIRDVASNFSINADNYVSAANFEVTLYTNVLAAYGNGSGWNIFPAAALIWILTYYQVKFFLMYIRRVVEIGFLIIISPLVTITYSIDKAGDSKAQAFQAWFSELLMKASIQIVHAILYVIFIGSAGYIAKAHPILAALFFTILSRAEKIVRKALNVTDSGFEKAKVPFMK